MSELPVESEVFDLVMDGNGIAEVIDRMAGEFLNRHKDVSNVVVAGIQTRGVEVARRLTECLRRKSGIALEVGAVDVSMHRDDLATRQKMTALEAMQLPLDLNNRPILLVDDVLYTGRSCRAAMDAIASFGRPAWIELAVLVDRGHREMPIQAEYIGRKIETVKEERVRVRFENLDGVPDGVGIVRIVK